MKKIVTALMIILPLILLVTVLAVTNIASISAHISVSGISISGKETGILAFDIATYEGFNEEDLGVTVYPREAKNKEYSLKITDAETGEETNKVHKDQDGNFILEDTGNVKLTYTTIEGNYSDSVVFNITSSGVLNFTPKLLSTVGDEINMLKDDDIYVAYVGCGTYSIATMLYPTATIAEEISFNCQEEGAKLNTLTGEITFLLSGIYDVNIRVKGIKGDIYHTLRFNVSNNISTSFAINGSNYLATIQLPQNSYHNTIYVETISDLDESDFSISGAEILSYEIHKLRSNCYAIDLLFASTHPDETSLEIHAGMDVEDISVEFVERTFKIFSQTNSQGTGDIVMLSNASTIILVDSDGDNIEYVWNITGSNFTFENTSGSQIKVESLGNGRETLTITAYVIDEEDNVIESYNLSRNIIATPRYTSLLFAESSLNTGLSKLAIATKTISDNGVVETKTFKPSLLDRNQQLTSLIDLNIYTSTSSIATVSTINDITVNIVATGEVTLYAEWIYAAHFGLDIRTNLSFIGVEGIEVTSYNQLKNASSLNEQIVLKKDIHIGEDLFNHSTTTINGITTNTRTPKYDNAEMQTRLLSYLHTMPTTWDWMYYSNLGIGRPNIYYIFEFTNNVYGNGHYISADYITNMIDDYGVLADYAVFRGPLNFVATSTDENGMALAAVKGQDNICFLARKNNLILENLVLKGCDDESLYSLNDNGNLVMDLTRLNYCGTTLEIMNNITISNCRISNGRNVVRSYGKDNINFDQPVIPETERIIVNIDKSILSNAREFILKIGTNRYERGNEDTPSPALIDENGQKYNQHNKSSVIDLKDDEYFYSHYVLTDVHIKDTTFKNSGLFSIGMESHFAGPMLAKAIHSLLPAWHDLAATSYPAILHLEGDVRFSDWKNISNVDSSTLIETSTNISDSMFFLKLDVGAMLTEVQKTSEHYKDIVTNINGQTMAHGGIAIYGGGKNYSIVDMSTWDYAPYASTYNINLNVLENSTDEQIQRQGQLLPSAAGIEDFRFIMYDANSYNQTKDQ